MTTEHISNKYQRSKFIAALEKEGYRLAQQGGGTASYVRNDTASGKRLYVEITKIGSEWRVRRDDMPLSACAPVAATPSPVAQKPAAVKPSKAAKPVQAPAQASATHRAKWQGKHTYSGVVRTLIKAGMTAAQVASAFKARHLDKHMKLESIPTIAYEAKKGLYGFADLTDEEIASFKAAVAA